MSNKIKLKKYLICTFIISIILISIFLIINIFEYKAYTKNFNNKLSAITLEIKESYPNISEGEILQILNSKDVNTSIFEKYSIDINKDSTLVPTGSIVELESGRKITVVLYGDVNQDGKIGPQDALEILEVVAGKATLEDEAVKKAANINN